MEPESPDPQTPHRGPALGNGHKPGLQGALDPLEQEVVDWVKAASREAGRRQWAHLAEAMEMCGSSYA